MRILLITLALTTYLPPSPLFSQERETLFFVEWEEASNQQGEAGIVLRASSHDDPTLTISHWLIESPAGNRLKARFESQVTATGAWRTTFTAYEPITGFLAKHVIDRAVGATALPFSNVQAIADSNEIFQRMEERPELTTEMLSVDDLSVTYSAKDAISAAGDQPPILYGMRRLALEGLAPANLPDEVLDVLAFGYQANCVARGPNLAKGDAFCAFVSHSGFLQAVPARVPSYTALRLEGEGEARVDSPAPQHVERMLALGGLRLTKTADGP